MAAMLMPLVRRRESTVICWARRCAGARPPGGVLTVAGNRMTAIPLMYTVASVTARALVGVAPGTDFAYRPKRPATLHFGLGLVDRVDVRLVLPDGAVATYDDVPVDQARTFDPVPRSLSESARAVLESTLPTGDIKVDRFVTDAIDRIEQSLEPSWWTTDTTLDAGRGGRVFDRQHQAVIALGTVDHPAPNTAVENLIEAPRLLAIIQLERASQAGGHATDIARAREGLAAAADFVEAGRFDKAVLEYKSAWTDAVKAVR